MRGVGQLEQAVPWTHILIEALATAAYMLAEMHPAVPCNLTSADVHVEEAERRFLKTEHWSCHSEDEPSLSSDSWLEHTERICSRLGFQRTSNGGTPDSDLSKGLPGVTELTLCTSVSSEAHRGQIITLCKQHGSRSSLWFGAGSHWWFYTTCFSRITSRLKAFVCNTHMQSKSASCVLALRDHGLAKINRNPFFLVLQLPVYIEIFFQPFH